MRDNVPCEFPAGYDGTAILERLAQVLDPELDESILGLGFVHSLPLRSGRSSLTVLVPTRSGAGNFAELLAAGRPVGRGSAAMWRRYLERGAEVALDCGLAAPLMVDLDGEPLSAERLLAHYEAARTVRVALEANGSFCRALLGVHRLDAAGSSRHENRGGRHVQS